MGCHFPKPVPYGISHTGSSDPHPGGGHTRPLANDPVENEGANHFFVAAEVVNGSVPQQLLPELDLKPTMPNVAS